MAQNICSKQEDEQVDWVRWTLMSPFASGAYVCVSVFV